MQDCVEVLDKIGYKKIGDAIPIKGGSATTRIISLKYEVTTKSEEIEKLVRELAGIISVSKVHAGSQIKLTVSYDSSVLKGSEIVDIIFEREPNYRTINHTVLSFKSSKNK